MSHYIAVGNLAAHGEYFGLAGEGDIEFNPQAVAAGIEGALSFKQQMDDAAGIPRTKPTPPSTGGMSTGQKDNAAKALKAMSNSTRDNLFGWCVFPGMARCTADDILRSVTGSKLRESISGLHLAVGIDKVIPLNTYIKGVIDEAKSATVAQVTSTSTSGTSITRFRRPPGPSAAKIAKDAAKAAAAAKLAGPIGMNIPLILGGAAILGAIVYVVRKKK